jgi:transcriptional regulator with XRE-family HTH domain
MGYTQEELAELVDVHPRMVQKIEAGETNILATTAMRLQAALDCEWQALMPSTDRQSALKKRLMKSKRLKWARRAAPARKARK